MLSQVSVEHDNNYWVNCVKSQDCRRTLAGEARTKAGNDTYNRGSVIPLTIQCNFFSISNIYLNDTQKNYKGNYAYFQ